MDIVRERLEREYDLDLLATTPNVEYHVRMTSGEMLEVHSPADMPDPNYIEAVEEPYIRASIITPPDFVGPIMELCQARRGRTSTCTTCPSSVCRCATTCRWPRSCSTSTTS